MLTAQFNLESIILKNIDLESFFNRSAQQNNRVDSLLIKS